MAEQAKAKDAVELEEEVKGLIEQVERLEAALSETKQRPQRRR